MRKITETKHTISKKAPGTFFSTPKRGLEPFYWLGMGRLGTVIVTLDHHHGTLRSPHHFFRHRRRLA
jgi:hypothetical protein